MQSLTELDRMNVFDRIFNFIMIHYGDSDYAYFWTRTTRDNDKLCRAYLDHDDLIDWLEKQIHSNYLSYDFIKRVEILKKCGLYEPVKEQAVITNQFFDDNDDSDLLAKFPDAAHDDEDDSDEN